MTPVQVLDATLVIIDGSTLASTAVTVGKWPVGIAVNPVTNQLFVADVQSEDVTIINVSGKSTTIIPSVLNPYAIAVNPITNLAYVADYGNCETYCPGGYSTINPSQGRVRTFPSRSLHTTLSPLIQDNTIYIANEFWANSSVTGIVTILDGNTNLTTSVEVGNLPVALAVNPVRKRVCSQLRE